MLVAIAIPVFTTQLERSRESADLANIRSAYGELVTQYLTDGKANSASIAVTQTQDKWQTANNAEATSIGTDLTVGTEAKGGVKIKALTTGSYVLAIDTTGSVSQSTAE